jgi:hypothetical protein
MSGSCKSTAQNCVTQCCDYLGNCPQTTSDCYFYYSNNNSSSSSDGGLSGGAITGIAIGGFVFILVVALLISFCLSKGRVGPVRRYPPPGYPQPGYLQPVTQATATTIVTQAPAIPRPPIIYGTPQPAFNSMNTSPNLPPAYHNTNVYNIPQPYNS